MWLIHRRLRSIQRLLVILFAMPSRVVVRFAFYLSAEIERFKDIIGGRGLVYLNNNNSNDNYNRTVGDYSTAPPPCVLFEGEISTRDGQIRNGMDYEDIYLAFNSIIILSGWKEIEADRYNWPRRRWLVTGLTGLSWVRFVRFYGRDKTLINHYLWWIARLLESLVAHDQNSFDCLFRYIYLYRLPVDG